MCIRDSEQIVSKVKAKYADADASSLSGTVAIQINLTDVYKRQAFRYAGKLCHVYTVAAVGTAAYTSA